MTRAGTLRGRQGALVDILARHPNQAVPVGRIVEELWPGIDPETGRARLHVVASRARRQLPPGTALEAVGDGYRLLGGVPEAPAVAETETETVTDAETETDTAADRDGPEPTRDPSLTVVGRERLLARLAASGSVPLFGVSAPTGFGKTVLLRQWAARQPGPVRWVDLADAGDGVEAALDAALGVALRATAGAPRPPGGPVAVVVDGLERARHLDVGPRLEAVVRRRSPVTLVLASREALPVAASRMAVRGELVLVGPRDLALTPGEADELCPGAGARLVRATGGWPEAVARAAGAPGPGTDEALDTCRPLVERVLDALPDDLRGLLVATGWLDEVTDALADAIRAEQGSGAGLSALADRHQLLVRVEGGYVPHPLLRRLLARGQQQGNGDGRLGRLRAARWHLRHGDVEEALDHAVAAPDHRTVRAAFLPAVIAAGERGDAATLGRWTETVRPPSGDDQTRVATVVWALAPPEHERWRPGPEASAGVDAAVRAVHHHTAGQCELALHTILGARAQLAADRAGTTALVEALLLVVEAEARVLLDRPEESGPSLRRVLDAAPWPWLVMWAFGPRALAAELAGRRREAAALLDHGRARSGALHPSWARLAPGSWLLARALVDLDRETTAVERARATADLAALVERLDRSHRPLAVVARHALHLAGRRAGDEEGAARWLAEADALAATLPPLPLLPVARAALLARAQVEPVGPLSAQERQVLGYLSTDLALTEIAELLFLSPHTVKAHTRSIYRKLRVHSRGEAVDAVLRA